MSYDDPDPPQKNNLDQKKKKTIFEMSYVFNKTILGFWMPLQ